MDKENLDLLIFSNSKIDKKLNLLLNMFDSYMFFRYGVRFNTKTGAWDLWKK